MPLVKLNMKLSPTSNETQRRNGPGIHRWWSGVLALGLALILTSARAEQTCLWQNVAFGKWTDAWNWLPATTYPANVETNLYSATVDFAGATVLLNTNITLERLQLGHGTIQGTNDPVLTVNQALDFGNGYLTGAGTLLAGSLSVTGTVHVLHGWRVENRGMGHWSEGDWHTGDGFHFVNTATGEFEATGDGNIAADVGGPSLFENNGVFRKSDGTNQTQISIPVRNAGKIEAAAGQLVFSGNTTNVGGQYEVQPGATLKFMGIRHEFDAASAITGAGQLNLDNGTLDISGGVDVQGPVVLNLARVNLNPAGTVTQLGSTLTFAGSGTLGANSGEVLHWNSLVMSNGLVTGSDTLQCLGDFQWQRGTFQGTGQLQLSGNSLWTTGSKSVRGWEVINGGTIQWQAGDVTGGEGGRFVNLAGGSLNLSYAGNWQTGWSGGWYFDNHGAFLKSAGSGTSLMSAIVFNDGLAEVASGALQFNGVVTNQGTLAVDAGATMIFSAGNHQLTALGSLDGEGAVILENGTITNAGAFRAAAGVTLKGGALRFITTTSRPHLGAAVQFNGAGTLDLSSGYTVALDVLRQTNGLLTGSDAIVISNQWICVNGDLNGPGTLELRGDSWINGGHRWASRQIVNYGNFTWAGGDLDGGSGLIFENGPGGDVDITSSNRFTLSQPNGAALRNLGHWQKSGAGTTTLSPALTNYSTMVLWNGLLQCNGGYTQLGGTLFLSGGDLGSTQPMQFHIGNILGNGNLFGSVVNDANFIPNADNSRITVTGNYTQTAAGTLQLHLKALDQFCSLAVGGNATLDGTLALVVAPEYVPHAGDSFLILPSSGCSGKFATVTGADLGNGLRLVPAYQPNGVVLQVIDTTVPPPVSIQPVPGTNAVTISWPDGYADYTLQTCTNLQHPVWTDLPFTNVTSAILPVTAPVQFFRVMRPAAP